jgi:hypothetical protein
MLRVVRIEAGQAGHGDRVRVDVAGQVRGRWVGELRRVCTDLLDAGHPVEIEMTEVSFVDDDGLDLFQELTRRGVALVNCALFVAEQLKSVEQDV